MIQQTFACTRCRSTTIVKNGHNASGSPLFKCHHCGRTRVLTPKVKYSPEQKQLIINTPLERGSLRAMQRLFGVAPATLTGWIKKNQSDSHRDRPSA